MGTATWWDRRGQLRVLSQTVPGWMVLVAKSLPLAEECGVLIYSPDNLLLGLTSELPSFH